MRIRILLGTAFALVALLGAACGGYGGGGTKSTPQSGTTTTSGY
jgi:hypothetical protein